MTTARKAASGQAFDMFSPAFIENPYPVYAMLRATQPMFWAPFEMWLSTRHADVSLVLRDRRFGKCYEQNMVSRFGPEVRDRVSYQMLVHTMLVADPPDHTRLRGLVVKAFTARRVEEMRPRIEALVSGLLDAVEGRGEMDVVADLAHRLPVEVICDMLGMPEEDRGPFLERSRVSGRLIDPAPMTPEDMAEAQENNAVMSNYFRSLIERRRVDPSDDLTTALVQAESEEGRLSLDELVANIVLLFAAGHETTANLIGNGLLALHRHPEQIERLKAEPDLMPNAVEELLRYDSSVQLTTRTALEDVEVGGTPVKRGQQIMTLLGAANRDPEMWPDPDRLDVARPGVKAISFGGGIHHCLGAQLARIEAEVVFRQLFERLPGLRLVDPENPQWRQTVTLRGLKALPARW